MAIFNISPFNSLQFVRKDGYLSSFRNTAYQDITSLARKPYCQMINNGDTVTIQVKTDYTSVTAVLYNVLTNTETALTETLTGDYTDFDFWEIPITFSTNGYYKIFITGLKSGSAPARWESEMIEVRTSWGGVKIDYYYDASTPYIDYSNDLVHMVRVDGILRFADVGGKDEYYNNLGSEERVYSEQETIYDLAVENIPYYLARQLVYASKCDVFKVNDTEYVSKEHSLTAHLGSHNYDLTIKLTEKEVIGVNADDEDHSFTWSASTSGDDIVETGSAHTYNANNTILEKTLYHASSAPGVELECYMRVYRDGSIIHSEQVTFYNNSGSIFIIVPQPVFPGSIYYIDYNF